MLRRRIPNPISYAVVSPALHAPSRWCHFTSSSTPTPTRPGVVEEAPMEHRRLSILTFLPLHRRTELLSDSLVAWRTAVVHALPRVLRTRPNGPQSSAARDQVAGDESGGDGSKPPGSGKRESSRKNKLKNNNNGEDPDGTSDPEDDVTLRVWMFVGGAFLVSYALYRLACPSGVHVGWTTLKQRAAKLTEISVYHNFVQAKTSDDERFYVGTYSDEHTQKKLTELESHFHVQTTLQQQQQPQQAPAGVASQATSPATQPQEQPQRVEVQVIGEPLASRILYGFGVVAWVVPFIFFPSFVMILTRAMGTAVASAGDGRSKLKQMTFNVQFSSSTRFHSVAGMKEAKREITEIVDFLKRPEKFTRLGAKIPTGALLLGPPGTGKTLLAKAVAGEAGIGFIPVCGSDFVELYVGMGALRVRQLFEVAKKQRCIVYIDEIDAIGLKRRGAGHGEKQEQEHTLNELLTQLDGFGSSRGQVMILASSNVPQDQLDPALIRPGRFDRIVHVDAPVLEERVEIFKVHLCKLKLVDTEERPSSAVTLEPPATTGQTVTAPENSHDNLSSTNSSGRGADGTSVSSLVFVRPPTAAGSLVDNNRSNTSSSSTEQQQEASSNTRDPFSLEELLSTKSEVELRLISEYAERMSGLCPGFVGADIANVCNEGAILAAREGSPCVTIAHLERSIDRVLAGIEHRSRVLSDFERTVVAHHEAGHAVAGWFLNRADPLMKVSIVPRGGSALGYAQYLPSESRMRTASEIVDSMCVTLGGRVAEAIFFQHLSTGASDDLQKVCRMAYMHVSGFGAAGVPGGGATAAGGYVPPGSEATRYVKPFGSDISDRMDVAAKALVDQAYERTLALLTSKKKEMEILAKHLLEKEVLTFQDVVQYLGARQPREKDRKPAV